MSHMLISSKISVPPPVFMCASPPSPLKPESGLPPSPRVVGQDNKYDNKDLEGWLEEHPLQSDPELDIKLDLESD